MFSQYLSTSVFAVLGALSIANAYTWSPIKPLTSLTERIDFTDNPNDFDFSRDAPKVETWFGRKNHAGVEEISSETAIRMTLDTGSCGIIISKTNLLGVHVWDPAEATIHNDGYQFLSSSKKLYLGHWVERYLYFNHKVTGREIKAKVPILVVDETHQCDDYVVGGGRECPTPNVVSNPDIAWMGIGFGRTYDG